MHSCNSYLEIFGTTIFQQSNYDKKITIIKYIYDR
jgi:hypothetical protein